MGAVSSRCARLWRRIVRAYRLACAQDDAVTRGITIPVGVWVCKHCEKVLLERDAFQRHLRTAHAT